MVFEVISSVPCQGGSAEIVHLWRYSVKRTKTGRNVDYVNTAFQTT